ncbi:hypothetical protein GZ77_24070 [Endozoicomonas montiporae]|uniref:Uncharacterized protein n=2 Tax=Endozoicomonas montiporae TaxID=1027273 RepID=A0A081MZI0_9GAMM|nr:hypothetical protein [Endozoicomonas montiporae]AMO54715.1 Mn2+dependent serine/threonine protein kinase [Endozoicomonas montiporae CL-33]KEQ11603.1 hypothetical protein GZ77_24070 [Endozoicomonas montiporae]
MLDVEKTNKLLFLKSNKERVDILTRHFNSSDFSQLDKSAFVKFIASLYPRYDQQVLEALESTKVSASILTNQSELLEKVFHFRKRLSDNLINKINNTKTLEVNKTKITASPSDQQSEIIELLKNVDQIIHGSECLGHGKITKIYKHKLSCGKQVIIKQYKSSSFFYKLTRSFVKSRALICWQAAHLFKLFGIPTAEPLGMSEERHDLFLNASYYVSEFVDGQVMADFYENDQPQDSWDRVSSQIEDMLVTFPKVFMTHGDFKATNFIIKDNLPCLIDLDSVTLYQSKYFFRKSYTRHIDRFEQNWKVRPAAEKHFTPFIARIRNAIP